MLIAIVLFSTRLLTRTVLVNYYLPFEAFWYMFISVFTIFYACYVLLVQKRVQEIHFYFVLIFFLPFQSGISAYLSEHYPILSGIISQRHWYGIGGVFLIVYLLEKKFYTIQDLLRAFEWLGWMCLVFFISNYIFLDPTKYLDYSFVGYSDIKGGYRFKFGVDFIAFLSVYYMIKFMQERNRRVLWLSIIHLAYLFFLHQGRTVMIAVAGCIFMYYMFDVNWKKAITYIFILSGAFVLLMAALYMIMPSRVNDYIIQYTSIIDMFRGDVGEDSSVDARLEEMGILFVYLLNYPIGWIIGIGKLASSEDATPGLHDIGTVPPGDIGIFGSIMTYGAIGTIIIYMQFLIAFRSLKFIKRFKKDTFLVSAKYFLLYSFLTSLAKGYLFMQPGSTAIFIVVIYAFKVYEVQQSKAQLPDLTQASPVLSPA